MYYISEQDANESIEIKVKINKFVKIPGLGVVVALVVKETVEVDWVVVAGALVVVNFFVVAVVFLSVVVC